MCAHREKRFLRLETLRVPLLILGNAEWFGRWRHPVSARMQGWRKVNGHARHPSTGNPMSTKNKQQMINAGKSQALIQNGSRQIWSSRPQQRGLQKVVRSSCRQFSCQVEESCSLWGDGPFFLVQQRQSGSFWTNLSFCSSPFGGIEPWRLS